MLTRSLPPAQRCLRDHDMRYDVYKRRYVCDVCEGAGRKEKKKASGAKSSNKPSLSLVPAVQGTTEAPPASQSSRIQTQELKRPGVTEEVIQNNSIGALRNKNYLVLVNSVKLKGKNVTCRECGHEQYEAPNHATGQTPGIPDLSVSHASWHHPLLPARLLLGIEEKGPKTAVSPEQKKLNGDGFSVIARTQEQNLAYAAQVDTFFAYLDDLERLKALCATSTHPDVLATLRRLESYAPLPAPQPASRKKKIS